MSTQDKPHVSKLLSRRRFLKGAALFGLGAGSALTGCVAPLPQPVGQSSQTSVTSAPPPPAVAEIAFWDMVWGPGEYVDTGKKVIDRFNASQSTIKVTYQSTPWANWYQTFLTAIGSGTAPDMSTGAAYQAVYFMDQGAVLPINDVVDDLRKDGKLEDVVPGAVERLKYKDRYCSLPWALDIRTMWCRKDVLDAAGATLPTNWDEFKAAVKACTKGDQYGYVIPGSDSSGDHNVWAWLFNNGGGWFTPDLKVDAFNDRNVEAVQFYADLVKGGWIHPGSAGFDGDASRRTFGQGQAAFAMDNPDGPANFSPEVADKLAIVHPLSGPHGDKGTISWVNNRMIFTQSKHQPETKTFMKWLFNNDLEMWTAGHCGNLPVRKSYYADPYFTKKSYLKVVQEEWIPVGKAEGEHVPGVFPLLHPVSGETFMRTLNQDLLQGKDVKESLQRVEDFLKVIVK